MEWIKKWLCITSLILIALVALLGGTIAPW